LSKIAILLGILWAAVSLPAAATQLVADLSQHKINISTGFSGTELLLFGAADPGGDVAVVVSGPEGQAVVRKKQRISGIWINADSVVFDAVPGFFHVSATPRLSAENLDRVLSDIGIGLRYQNLSPALEMPPERAAEFRSALLRRKEAQGLYAAGTGEIEFVGGTLFRTQIWFPANVPTGEYRVHVYHVKDGWVNSIANIPLTVGKVGMEEAIYRFATDHPALYGIFAIVIAALSGYGAGMLFGRR
jgi:uncharacterized protein (TIGR02186 family)